MARQKMSLRVEKGSLVPADAEAAEMLRAKGLRIGDVVHVELTKLRNPRFNALAHAIGRLCTENIEAFAGMDAHAVLKRLQLESGLECSEQVAELPDGTQYLIRQPRSMAFDKMDELQFSRLVSGLCSWISARYWPQLTAKQIEDMSAAMVD
jgi:hypothetical protein